MIRNYDDSGDTRKQTRLHRSAFPARPANLGVSKPEKLMQPYLFLVLVLCTAMPVLRMPHVSPANALAFKDLVV
jgi:hypothetical protein